jgi:hypothetical protein
MTSFKEFMIENRSIVVTIYHGNNARFDKFDQRKSRVVNDNYGVGIAYFTDAPNLAMIYSKSMAKKHDVDALIYTAELKLSNLFDVDEEFTGKKLVDILPADVNGFARGAAKLTGEQVYRGLSKGNTQTAKARDYLIEKGYDGLRYNNMRVTPKQSVYLAYDSNNVNQKTKIGA